MNAFWSVIGSTNNNRHTGSYHRQTAPPREKNHGFSNAVVLDFAIANRSIHGEIRVAVGCARLLVIERETVHWLPIPGVHSMRGFANEPIRLGCCHCGSAMMKLQFYS